MTSGGDAPGLNAVIRAAVTAARQRNYTVLGLREGFRGLLERDELIPLNRHNTEGIERQGGTILGAASGGNPFSGGKSIDDVAAALERHAIDALIMAGGDGTMQIANQLASHGLRVVGVPKTIDRDVVRTWMTFGFDSATSVATEAIDRLHSTAAAHRRVFVVEVMGRDVGWIALYAGISGGAHAIAIPEIPYRTQVFANYILEREGWGSTYHILVASEGAREAGGEALRSERTGRYSGVAEKLAADVARLTGNETRSLSLGHLLRGGPPTGFDRMLGLRFGEAAVSAIEYGESGVMIASIRQASRRSPSPRWRIVSRG